VPERENSSDYIQTTFTFEEDRGLIEVPVDLRRLYEGLAPYIDIQQLRQLAAEHGNIYEALRSPTPPLEVQALLATLVTLLRPSSRDQIRRPAEAVDGPQSVVFEQAENRLYVQKALILTLLDQREV